MDENGQGYKPAFLDVPTSYKKRGKTKPSDVGMSEELAAKLRAINGPLDLDAMIKEVIGDEEWLLKRESVYRDLNRLKLRSLGIERNIKFAERLTHGCIIYMLLNQDINCLNEGGDPEKDLRTSPLKQYVHEPSEELRKLMSETEKKEKKARVKAGRSTATEELFDQMVALYPEFMSKQDDPRYSLARTKKIVAEVLEGANIDIGTFDLPNYTFYATEREVGEGNQEIFLRFMKAKNIPDFVDNESTGKFTGTSEQCLKKFKSWAKKLGIPELEKHYAEKKVEAAKAAKTAKKSEGSENADSQQAEPDKTAKKAKKANK
jgi:hypothetical protein